MVQFCHEKDGTRITFLVGRKALEYSQNETSILRQLRKEAGCSTSNLPLAYEKVVNHSNELAREINRLWSLLLPNFVEKAQIDEVDGVKVGIQIAQIPRQLLAKLAVMIAHSVNGAGIVVSGHQIAVSSCGISAKEILDRILNSAGGKRGGRLQQPMAGWETIQHSMRSR